MTRTVAHIGMLPETDFSDAGARQVNDTVI